MRGFIVSALALLLVMATSGSLCASRGLLSYEIIGVLPHDPKAFTQGLAFSRGLIFESTGKYGRSSLRVLDPATGRRLDGAPLPPNLFGEGLAVCGDKLIQLTWRSGLALVYDMDSLKKTGEMSYAGEGWGLAMYRDELVMSNGTDELSFRDPQGMAVARTVRVRHEGRPVSRINELEVAGGHVLANIWRDDRVAVIDPDSGQVRARVDLSGLRQGLGPGAGVLNGMAWDPGAGVLYVTGKFWDRMYKLRLSFN